MTELDYAPDYSLYTPGLIQSLIDMSPTITGGYQTNTGPYLEGYTRPAAATDVVGSAIVKDKAGTAKLYAGTTNKIYQANGTTGWTDRSGAMYSSTGSWDFAQFGDLTVAASGGDALQGATAGAFSAIATAPVAKLVIVHENALIAFNLSTDSAGWARSDTGSTTFTVLPANDADAGTLLNGSGPITAATTFQNLAIAWKGDWMYGGRFVGDIDIKVKWDTLARGIGCVGQHAYIETEVGLIFVSNRDILLFDGSVPRSIADKVRKTFLQDLSPSTKANILLTHDEINRNIYIWYPRSGDTYCTRAWIYNYKTGKWGHRDSLSNITNTGYSYVRARVVGANYPDYQLIGGIGSNTNLEANVVWANDGAGRLVNYAPSAAQAGSGQSRMTLGLWGDPGTDSNLTGAKVIYESTPSVAISSATVTAYGPSLSASFNVVGTVDPDGNVNANSNNRFHQLQLTWTQQLTSVSIIKSIEPCFYGTGGSR